MNTATKISGSTYGAGDTILCLFYIERRKYKQRKSRKYVLNR